MPYDLPWTDSELLVKQRVLEELLKRGYGDQKVKIVLPIFWFEELDVFENFIFQDPFGLDAAGGGEKGRYYYVESMSFDFEGGVIEIVAIDLQWLLRQYFILGPTTIAPNWATASESDRMYGYLCNPLTNQFNDGEPGKKL
jgi:hypothetical protein